MQLNPPQREAVEHKDGPLLVLAGAGSGKTRVITHRIARLMERGVDPKRILALTFTNKAAGEMRERARAKDVWIGTFHALGLQLLREYHRRQPFTIYDASDQLGLVREVLRRMDWEGRRFDPKALLFRISRWKNGAEQTVRDEYDECAAEVFPKYQEGLRGYAAYDFDDLICEPVRLARPEWQHRWDYILVDEYQDTNGVQLRLLQHLGERHGNVCVVGDDDQSIYGWRGAQASNILAFERHFKGARIVKLEENYRSRPQILAAANAVIKHNPARHEKTLWTHRSDGPAVRLAVLADAEAEARFVANEISALRVKPGDCAVLYRSNVQSRAFEDALREAGIAYHVTSGNEFYERKEVKDVLAYVRVALWPRDEISLRRCVNYPARGIGPATLAKAVGGKTLFDGLRDHAPEFCKIVDRLRVRLDGGDAAGAVRALVDEIGLYDDLHDASPSAAAAQRRIGNVEDLINGLSGRKDIRQYLNLLLLRSSEEEDKAPGDSVTLATLHGSKGLEFPVVFLAGLEEDLLPHSRVLNPIATDVTEDSADLAEERRLLYVGITRARERLYLLRAAMRVRWGRAAPTVPSRFLEEIPPDMLQTSVEDDGAVADECMAQLKALIGEGR
jgi:ATP-dependent DNA helicase UvrD/PcrA